MMKSLERGCPGTVDPTWVMFGTRSGPPDTRTHSKASRLHSRRKPSKTPIFSSLFSCKLGGPVAAKAGVLNASQITSSPSGVGLTVYLHSRGSQP
jgi:hypothetical protein